MKCAEFEQRLNQVLDERRRPEWDADLRLHADTCPSCHELAAGYEVLLDGFYALATPEPPTDLAIRVVDELGVHSSLARRVSIAAVVAVATAASLFLAIALVESRREAAKPNAPPRAVALAATQPAEQPATDWSELRAFPVVHRVLVSISEGDDPYAAFAKGTGQRLANVVLYMPTAGGSPSMVAPEVVNGTASWPVRVSEGFRPVTESVGETIDLLLEALPMSERSKRS